MKKLLVCLVAVALAQISLAQSFSRYIIQFRNKAGTPYSLSSPLQFLSQRALDRRTRYNVSVDSTDLPVTPRYIDSLRLAGAVTVLNASRWFNSVTIQTTDQTALAKINALTFVQSVAPVGARFGNSGGKKTKENLANNRVADDGQQSRVAADFFSYGQSFDQVRMHNGQFLHNIGLRGQAMVIGMLDGGFRSYTTLRAFDSVNQNGQVLGTYDFVAREASVVEDISHGMHCFSIIAANIPGQFVGTAPKASFYLFRSEEDGPENPVEEHNWVCAAERLDSAGGDVISSSLGYTTFDNAIFNHTYQQLNGNTTLVTRGADLAAKKGILVVNSAGNEGDDPWKYLAAPADGDSVLAVGAVRRDSVPAGFTSFGPSSDGQVKPDVASLGVATTLQTEANTIGAGNGTSYSAPNLAGLATCLWQGFPEVTNHRIIVALRQAGHKASSPDERVGYGIPDMKKAMLSLLKDFSSAGVSASTCKNTVSWTSKDIGTMKYEIERRAPGEATFSKVSERQATGNSFGVRSYSFADTLINVQAGSVAYRIRQIVDTAAAGFRADYIDTVMVNVAAGCVTTAVPSVLAPGESVLLHPNPAQANLTVKVTTANAISNLHFRIVNAKGQLLRTERRSKAAGTASFDVSISGLAAGKYFVSVYNGQKLLATRELLKL